MKKYNFYMTDVQLDTLNRLTKISGVKISEHLRRAIDEYLERHQDDLQKDRFSFSPSAIPNARTSHVPRSDPADSRGGENDEARME